nr:MAG TPA: hypothetical protein [Caudoviricetes sp.]
MKNNKLKKRLNKNLFIDSSNELENLSKECVKHYFNKNTSFSDKLYFVNKHRLIFNILNSRALKTYYKIYDSDKEVGFINLPSKIICYECYVNSQLIYMGDLQSIVILLSNKGLTIF